jgi:hypothetical protein
MDWRCGSNSRAPAFKCEALSSDPSPTKEKKRKKEITNGSMLPDIVLRATLLSFEYKHYAIYIYCLKHIVFITYTHLHVLIYK